ncbi:MAG: extracellular solute-binding protein [Fermentimonas sp.]|nr:extracellular solute-binding protein [Fermentimonas sp.]
MLKKFFSLILVVLIMSSLLVGCVQRQPTGDSTDKPVTTNSPVTDKPKDPENSGSNSNFNETGYPITKEKSTFTILAATSVTDMANTQMMTEISEHTNVYPEWEVIPTSGREERISLMWGSGDYPDVLGPRILSRTAVNTYGPQGVLIPLNEYYDKYMTWFNELAPESIIGEMTCYDGNMYYIATITDGERWERQYMMNTEWLDKLNLSVPENIDDFYNCLVAIKNGDPNGNGEADEIPFAIGPWLTIFDTLPAFYCFFGRPGTYYIDDNGQVIDGRLYDEHMQGIKFLQKCYKEGLLDPELFTHDNTAFRAKGASIPPVYGFMMGYGIEYYVGSENSSQYEPMPLLSDPSGKKSHWFLNSNPVISVTSMAITKECENPEVVMRWANYLHTPEISMQVHRAPIGIGYDYDKDGNLYMITDVIPEGFDSLSSWRSVHNENQLPRLLGNIVNPYLKENFGYDYVPTDSRVKNDEAVEMYLPYAVKEIPPVTPTAEETEALSLYTADLEKYYEETVANWISTDADIEAEWDKFIADMNSLHAQEIIDIKQQQVDRYYENLK